MQYYKFFLKIHKWVGIIFSLVFLNIAVTGFLLLQKKNYAWLQPVTETGAEGEIQDFITTEELLDIVFRQGHEDFQSPEDIDRIDFRLSNRVHKVQSRYNHSEIQVDAVSGRVLNTNWRASDFIENLHDGSFFGKWFHDWLMPLVAAAVFFLTVSGLYIWIRRAIR